MATVDGKIRELLTWKGMSAYQLAELAGIPKGSIGRYVSGRTPISLDLLEKITDRLGVSAWVLMNGASLPATTEDLTPEEQEMVVAMRGISKKKRRAVLELVKSLADEKI